MKKALFALLVLGIGGPGTAAIINVPADQATIALAIAAANPSGDEIVVAPGTYNEAVLLADKSVTLRGSSSSNRPVIVLGRTGGSGGIGFVNSGMLIVGDGITVNVSDLILIPDTVNIPDRMVQASTRNTDATITVSITNVLITGNNGGVPSVTDPFDDVTALGTTATSDGMYLANRAFLGTLRDAIGIYTLTDVTVIGAGRDGIICYPCGPGTAGGGVGSSMTASGVKIARSTRHPIQWGDSNLGGADYIIAGSRSNPGLLCRNNNVVTGASSGTSGINGARNVTIDHLVHINQSNAAGAFYISAGNTASVSISNSLFASVNDDGLGLVGTTTSPNVVIDSCTFFNNGAVGSNTAGLWFGTVNPTFTVRNSIFAGSNLQGGLVFNSLTGPQVTLNNNAIVAAGPHALGSGQFGSGAPAGTETGTITADPEFSSTTISSLADLSSAFNVGSSAYVGSGFGSSNLGGFGTVTAAVSDWSAY